jgi:hypothetical protein
MGASQIGLEPDAVAGAATYSVADERCQFLAIESAIELGVGAGWLDYHHIRRQPAVGQ